MFVLFTSIVALCLLVLQTTVFQTIAIAGVKPDFIMVITVYLGLVKGPNVGCSSGFFFGIAEDLASGMTVGSNALAKTVVGFFCGMLGKRLYTQSALSHMLCTGIGTIINVIILLSIHGFNVQWEYRLVYEGLYNIVCCPVIVSLLRFGEQQLGVKSF